MGPDQNPRNKFDEAIKYALQVANGYLRLLDGHKIPLAGLQYFEIGPGTDFAPQLVLASYGAKVTLADKYLAQWDPAYHPGFYTAFLEHWSGPADAIKTVLRDNSHERALTLVKEPVENLSSIKNHSFDFVQSNAVLEHVVDIRRAARELARVT